MREELTQCENQGDFYYHYDNYHEALRWYNQAITIDPRNSVLRVKKANALLMLGRKNDAYGDYLSALLDEKALDSIDAFVMQNRVLIPEDTQQLQDLLMMKYHLPISREGLQFFLERIESEYADARRLKRWKRFAKKLEGKKLYSSEEIVDVFLQEFGEQYLDHLLSLQCYLGKFKGIQMGLTQLHELITDRINVMRVEQFERMLKRGLKGKKNLFDRMSGVQFEGYLATLFECQGFRVQKTPSSHDRGADLILKRFGEITVVQAKRWKQPVGPKAVQEVFTAQRLYSAQKALVVTTSEFSPQAKDMAENLGVKLWNRERLLQEVNNETHLF